MAGVIFTSKINQPSSPLMAGVVSQTYPFQVAWAIIKFIAVNVVYGKPIFISGYKSKANKTMHKNFYTAVLLASSNLKIAVAVFALCQKFFLKCSAKSLNFAVASSCVSAGMSRSFDLCSIRNKPTQTFKLNFFPLGHVYLRSVKLGL